MAVLLTDILMVPCHTCDGTGLITEPVFGGWSSVLNCRRIIGYEPAECPDCEGGYVEACELCRQEVKFCNCEEQAND
jgi:hypothetical protein